MHRCPGCGKVLENALVCKECSSRKSAKKKLDIKICSECSRVFWRGSWHDYGELSKAIQKITAEKVDIALKGPGVEEEIETGRHSLSLLYTYCERCSKKTGNYFEGVLQIRKAGDEILDFVENFLAKSQVFVTKQVRQEDGYDLYMTDRRKISSLGNALRKQFGGTLKESPTVFSKDHQTSKDIIRLSVYYEAPEFSKGDAISVDGKLILVTGVQGTVTGQDLMSGKRTGINLKKKDYKVLKPLKTSISKVYPDIEILHPETYDSVKVENKIPARQGQKVKVIEHAGKFYISSF